MIRLVINKEHYITIEEIRPKKGYTRVGRVFRLGKELPEYATMFRSEVPNIKIKKWLSHCALNPIKSDLSFIKKMANELNYIIIYL
jgi:hypothetical protein